jgi:hypothetical protein
LLTWYLSEVTGGVIASHVAWAEEVAGMAAKKKARNFFRAVNKGQDLAIKTKTNQGKLWVLATMIQVGLVPMFCTE